LFKHFLWYCHKCISYILIIFIFHYSILPSTSLPLKNFFHSIYIHAYNVLRSYSSCYWLLFPSFLTLVPCQTTLLLYSCLYFSFLYVDSAHERNHELYVFLSLAYFANIMITSFTHLSVNNKILFFFKVIYIFSLFIYLLMDT
jgi:hypothetical protein